MTVVMVVKFLVSIEGIRCGVYLVVVVMAVVVSWYCNNDGNGSERCNSYHVRSKKWINCVNNSDNSKCNCDSDNDSGSDGDRDVVTRSG